MTVYSTSLHDFFSTSCTFNSLKSRKHLSHKGENHHLTMFIRDFVCLRKHLFFGGESNNQTINTSMVISRDFPYTYVHFLLGMLSFNKTSHKSPNQIPPNYFGVPPILTHFFHAVFPTSSIRLDRSTASFRLLGGPHAEGFRKALSSDRINADAGGSGEVLKESHRNPWGMVEYIYMNGWFFTVNVGTFGMNIWYMTIWLGQLGFQEILVDFVCSKYLKVYESQINSMHVIFNMILNVSPTLMFCKEQPLVFFFRCGFHHAW